MHYMSKIEQIAYAAGLFDGEGTVTLALSSNKNAFRRVEISVSSTDEALCLAMLEILGGGHVYQKQSRGKDHWKQAHEYRWSGIGAKNALAAMRPYIRCPRKQHRIDIILNEFDRLTKRNGRYTPDEKVAKLDFERRFFTSVD